MTQCPCGSSKEYISCCGLFIDGENKPGNPETLMRSRYTAYTMARIDYIKKTMRGKPLIGFNEVEATEWAKQLDWLNLQVIKSYRDEQDENIGYVEFIANYRSQGKKQAIHELSKFEYLDGQWFYTDGNQPKTKVKLQKATVSRNAPCPCGSQKKYKNCHGTGKS